MTRECSQCGRRKPQTPEFFWRDSRAKDGWHSWCRDCLASRKRALRAKRLAAALCATCGKAAPRPGCASCQACLSRGALAYQAAREQTQEAHVRWKRANSEKVKEYHRRWYANGGKRWKWTQRRKLDPSIGVGDLVRAIQQEEGKQ